MANNYLQFSESLELKSPEEREWFATYLTAVDKDHPTHWDKKGTPISNAAKFWAEVFEEYDSDCLSFDVCVADKGVWFHADEGGNPSEVARWVQRFFKDMRPEGKDFFALSWAETCSKMRVGEFGGGAVFVTKDVMEFTSSWIFIEEMTLKYAKT